MPIVTEDSTAKTKTIWENVRTALSAVPGRADSSKLAAVLAAAVPEYCGFAADGALVLSRGFGALFGLQDVRRVEDIEGALAPSDAAALDGLFAKLQREGAPFTLTVRLAGSAPPQMRRIAGRRGQAAEGAEILDVLWAEDVTVPAREDLLRQSARTQAEEARDRLQGALDLTPVPVWIRDSRTDLIWCNRAYAQSLDTTPATVVAEQRELVLKPLAKKGAAPARPGGKALAQEAFDKGGIAATEGHVVSGGKRRFIEITEAVMPGQNQTIGFARDRTREEELETDQRRSTAAQRELLEHLGSAIAIFDSMQRLAFYNTAFAQLWQMDEQYLNNGPKLGDIMERLREARHLPEQADFRKFKQVWLNMFTGLINPHEDMLYLPDGRALRMLALPHSQGGLMMTFEDVTSRLELESSYNTLVAVQKETLDNLTEGVAVFGGNGRLRLFNPAFARLWSLHPEDLDGEPHVARLVEKMKLPFGADATARAQENLAAQCLDRRVQEGRMVWANGRQISYATVPLPDGGVLVTHADVTDSARVELALREKNTALETAEQVKLDFLANVSYQLRTPLNAIMGFAEILDNQYFGPLTGKQREYTQGMQEAGQRLIYLIDDILDLSTIEAGYMSLENDKVSVSGVVEGIYNLTRDWARKENISVKLDYAPGIGTIAADERRLKQALLNIVRNAINFTPAGGTITLSARRTDTDVQITVTDTGPGISPEDQGRIFRPFERSSAGSSSGKASRGAGLGLTLVKHIVEMHGGNVALESTEGKGTSVCISLPGGA